MWATASRLDAETDDVVLADVIRKYALQRDEAAQAFMPGFVDHAHAAAAQFADDFVAGDLLQTHASPGLGTLGRLFIEGAGIRDESPMMPVASLSPNAVAPESDCILRRDSASDGGDREFRTAVATDRRPDCRAASAA